MKSPRLEATKCLGAGLSITIFPLMLLIGFSMHPNLHTLGLNISAEELANRWHGNSLFYLGHFLVLFAVPLIIVACVRLTSLLTDRGSWFGFIGGVLAVFGAFILAVDKGTLTLLLATFQIIPHEQYEDMFPAIQALTNKQSFLWIFWFLLLLPLGLAAQLLGLIRERIIPRWQGIAGVIGIALLISPDNKIIYSSGAALICVAFIPIGVRELVGGLGRPHL